MAKRRKRVKRGGRGREEERSEREGGRWAGKVVFEVEMDKVDEE